MRVDTQQPSRAMGTLNSSVGGFESRFDVLPDDDVERSDASGGLLRGTSRRRARAQRILPECAGDVERPPLTDEHGAIHDRRHLANVSRPLILGKPPHIVIGDRYRTKAEAIGGSFREVLAKARMSLGRSRSGGITIGKTDRR